MWKERKGKSAEKQTEHAMRMPAFERTLEDYNIPFLILDQRWHALFQRLKKTEEIQQLEKEMRKLLRRQGELKEEQEDCRRLKSKLLHTIVHNMDGTEADMENSIQSKILEKNHALIKELNEKMERNEMEQRELPKELERVNQRIMVCTMQLCYQQSHENRQELAELSAWLEDFREELQAKVKRKRICEKGNREIYQFLEQMFGMDMLQIFDIDYEDFSKIME